MKRKLLANLLSSSGLLRPMAWLQTHSFIALGYHRIRPDDPAAENAFDDGVFGPTQSEFERQIKWLKQNFDILSENDLLDLIGTPRLRRTRVAMVTFDDGYRDNYDLAYPVLRAHSAPAVFFICPGLVDSQRLGWWDLIAYLVKKSQKSFAPIRNEAMPLGSQKLDTITRLHSLMKLLDNSETAGLLEELSAACGVDLPDRQMQRDQLMSWDQIREVGGNGVAIGSHTLTHRVLATLPEEDQRSELAVSKATLEARLCCVVRTLAYPVGGHAHFTPATMRLARECGYQAAFSFRTRAEHHGKIDPYNVPRIEAGDHCDAIFQCSLFMPRLFTYSNQSQRQIQ